MSVLRSMAIFGAIVATVAPAMAQSGADERAAREKFYDAPTKVNMGGRDVIADIALYAVTPENAAGVVHVALVTDVTKFIEQTERDLENWIAAHQEECAERWGASAPRIAFPDGAIRFALDLEYEFYNCGWNGKGTPWRVAREAGSIAVALSPEISEGKLQARLRDFSITDRSGVNKYLPLEFVTRRVLASELKKLNENPKFFRAPQPFHREGFVYEDIKAARQDGRVIITATYRAKGGDEKLERLTVSLRQDGIVSER